MKVKAGNFLEGLKVGTTCTKSLCEFPLQKRGSFCFWYMDRCILLVLFEKEGLLDHFNVKLNLFCSHII